MKTVRERKLQTVVNKMSTGSAHKVLVQMPKQNFDSEMSETTTVEDREVVSSNAREDVGENEEGSEGFLLEAPGEGGDCRKIGSEPYGNKFRSSVNDGKLLEINLSSDGEYCADGVLCEAPILANMKIPTDPMEGKLSSAYQVFDETTHPILVANTESARGKNGTLVAVPVCQTVFGKGSFATALPRSWVQVAASRGDQRAISGGVRLNHRCGSDDQVSSKIGTKKADSGENRDEDDDDVGISQTKVDDGKSEVENDDGSSDDGEVSSSEESSSDQDQASLSALAAKSEVKPGEIHKSAIVSANDEEEEGGVVNAIMFQLIVQDGALLAFSDHSTSLGKANIVESVMPSAVNYFEDGEVKGITPKCVPLDGDKCSQAYVSSPKQNQPIGGYILGQYCRF
ncbi:hypothetical protein U1Q18_009905 [Sarracenia purpurea var. burkii]